MCCRQEVNLESYAASTLGGMMHVLVNLEGYMVGYLQVVQVHAAQSWLAVDQDWILLFHLRHLQFLGEWVWYN